MDHVWVDSEGIRYNRARDEYDLVEARQVPLSLETLASFFSVHFDEFLVIQ